jgi:hypothetical protein
MSRPSGSVTRNEPTDVAEIARMAWADVAGLGGNERATD